MNEYDYDSAIKDSADTKTQLSLAGGKISRTARNIKKTLVAQLRKAYNIQDKEKLLQLADSLLKIHGMSDDNLDFIGNFEKLLVKKLNDESVDANSNKNEKSVKGYSCEASKPLDKLLGYDFLYRKMKELYGKQEAKRLSMLMYDFSLGLSDSSNILLPYCWAMDSSKLITIGRDFGMLQSKPVKRIDSYIAALCETIHQMAQSLAGAIAIGDLFLCMAYLTIKEKLDTDEPQAVKRIENELQQFIHSVNHLSRNATESPFTNVSVFDSEKLKMLIGDYGWMLEDLDCSATYLQNRVMSIQNIFMDLFEKGDPSMGGVPYRFPVCTINIAKSEEGKVIDESFLADICKRDISRFNIFTSKGTRVASCCRLLQDPELMELGGQVNSLGGGGSISLGSHRVVTLNYARAFLNTDSIYSDRSISSCSDALIHNAYFLDSYDALIESWLEDSAKILKAHKLLIKQLTEAGLEPFIANHWIRLDRMFSTFGILGLVEANELYQKKYEGDLIEHTLELVNKLVPELSAKYGIIGNIEQIPAESFAGRMADSDRLIFGYEDWYPLYANQFIPLWEDATIFERFNADGKYNNLITGGGIVHAQVDKGCIGEAAETIVKAAVQAGCEHFALNKVYSQCKDCNKVYNHKQKQCECGSDNMEYYTRVVGFLTPVSDWVTVRRDWEFERRKFVEI